VLPTGGVNSDALDGVWKLGAQGVSSNGSPVPVAAAACLLAMQGAQALTASTMPGPGAARRPRGHERRPDRGGERRRTGNRDDYLNMPV
jgi:hypothetical protein